MSKLLLCLFCLGFSTILKAQINLVPNGQFEETVTCGGNSSAMNFAMKDWFVPQNDTVKIENTCSYIDWWRFLRSKKIGLGGSYSGFIETYYKGFPDDFINSGRRYLAVKLKQRLVAGQQYYFEMYTRSVDTFPNYQLVNTVFTSGQDVAFVKETPLFDFDLPRHFLEIRPVFRSKFMNNYNWQKVNGCFTASGDEVYMVIGNFRSDANTETVTTGKHNSNFPNGLTSYYAIDNVVLTPMTLGLRDTAICVGDTLRLNVVKTIPDSVTYRWHTGATTPQYQSTQSENINVTVQYSEQCLLNASLKLKVITPEYKPIAQDTLLCVGTPVTFRAGVGLKGETIRWENGAKERDFTARTEGVYTAHIESHCAKWVDSFRLQTHDCGDGLYVPNAFSPDDDGNNDVFKPFFKSDFYPIENYEWLIFNRWGNLIFKTHSIEDAWNGQFQNKIAPSGMYMWVINIQYLFNGKSRKMQRSGDVVLMR